MSRGPGKVQRYVLAKLAEQTPRWVDGWRGRYWHGGWASIDELAAYWHHDQTCRCGEVDGCPGLFRDVPRASVESVRRACKALAEAGRAEVALRSTSVPYQRSSLDCFRSKLSARKVLSVEERTVEHQAQHLERSERDQRLAESAAKIRAALGGGG